MQAALLILQVPDAVFAHVLTRYELMPGIGCKNCVVAGLVVGTTLASITCAVMDCPLMSLEGDAAGTARV